MEAGQSFICALYGIAPGRSMDKARHQLYTRKRGKPMKIMALPPTRQNLCLHILRSHYAVFLEKAANQQAPPPLDLWNMKDGVPVPAISNAPAGPDALIDAIACGCVAPGKACSTQICSCHHHHLSCTMGCKCACCDGCHDPYTIQEDEDEEENENEVEDSVESPYAYTLLIFYFESNFRNWFTQYYLNYSQTINRVLVNLIVDSQRRLALGLDNQNFLVYDI